MRAGSMRAGEFGLSVSHSSFAAPIQTASITARSKDRFQGRPLFGRSKEHVSAGIADESIVFPFVKSTKGYQERFRQCQDLAEISGIEIDQGTSGRETRGLTGANAVP